MNQLLVVHEVANKTVLIIDRKQAPAVLAASASVEAAAATVCRMMQAELIASFGAQHVYQVHDGVELGVLVHVDLLRNRAHVIEWEGGTDLGLKIEAYLDGFGWATERLQVEFGSYLYQVLAGRCLVFDSRAVVLGCMAEADYDLAA